MTAPTTLSAAKASHPTSGRGEKRGSPTEYVPSRCYQPAPGNQSYNTTSRPSAPIARPISSKFERVPQTAPRLCSTPRQTTRGNSGPSDRLCKGLEFSRTVLNGKIREELLGSTVLEDQSAIHVKRASRERPGQRDAEYNGQWPHTDGSTSPAGTEQETEGNDLNRIIHEEGIVQGGSSNVVPVGIDSCLPSEVHPTPTDQEAVTNGPPDTGLAITFSARTTRDLESDALDGRMSPVSSTVPAIDGIEEGLARVGVNGATSLPIPVPLGSSACIRFTQSTRMSAPHVTPAYLDSRLPQGGLSLEKEASPGANRSVDTITPSRRADRVDTVIDPSRGISRLQRDLEDMENQQGVQKVNNNPGLSVEQQPPAPVTTVDNKTPEDLHLVTIDIPSTIDTERSCEEGLESPSDEDVVEDTSENDAESHTPMSFQIPPAALRAAMTASPNTPGSYYNQTLYRGPNDQFLTVHYCDNMATAERVAPYFLQEKVIGFDIEWRPWAAIKSIKDNASLIQLASEDRIALFHIALFSGTTAEELIPPTLRAIIESPDILKVGVAIKGDFSRLEKYLGIKARGVFELSRLHNLVEYSDSDPRKAGSKKLSSLAKQVHQHLQLPLYKGEVRESDWSKRLDRDQIAYAATDAYASLRIFDALEAKRKRLRPVPPRPEVCDYDEVTKPRTAPCAKSGPKAVEEPVQEEEPQAAVEDAEESEAAYETAAEDLVDSQQLEEQDSESASSAESADLDEEPDSDYVPSARLKVTGEAASAPRRTRRIGRINIGSLLSSDVKYPTLPDISSSDEADSGWEAESGHRSMDKQRAGGMGHKVDIQGGIDKDDMPVKNDAAKLHDLEDHQTNLSAPEIIQQGQLSIKPLTLETTITDISDDSPSTSGSPEVIKERAKLTTPSQPPTTSTTTLNLPSLATDVTSKSSAYLAADSWARTYLHTTIPSPSSPSSSATSRIRATVTVLRAYHLWHHQDLSPAEIARHLRDPPLAESTVCGYILQAVAAERLAYSRREMREVLSKVPLNVRMTRWRWLVERLGGLDK